MEVEEFLKVPEPEVVDKQMLSYAALAVSSAPAQNTADLRLKARTIMWLADQLDGCNEKA